MEKDIISYPIGMQHTQVGRIFERLNILKGSALKEAIQQGEITVDSVPATKTGDRVSVDQVVKYKDMEIHVCLDELEKKNRLLQESFRPGGGLRGTGNQSGPGYPSGGGK